MRIRTKLILLMLTLSFGVILGSALFSTISLDSTFHSRLVSELTTQANQTEFVVRNLSQFDSMKYAHLQQFAHSANIRLTIIDRTGSVIFDSELPQEKLSAIENHLQRPEVQEALRNGSGSSTRHSTTVGVDFLYLAKKISEPFPPTTGFGSAGILRVAIPLTQVNEVINDIHAKIAIASVLVLAFVIGIAVIVSHRLARPIAEMAQTAEEIRSGNLQKRISVRTKDEFGTLAESLNAMVTKLSEDITKLRKLEQVRSEFLGNVSHELRTPIFAIQGMLETLLQGALDDKEVCKDFVGRALANAQRLNTLLADLIEISRIESGDMKMSFRYFPLNEFLEQIVAEMYGATRNKGIQLTLEGDRSAIDVLGDKERLKQVMVNLIDNAIKYTQPNGRVIVSSGRMDGSVRISVSDTGVGIAQDHLPRIFERFYRVDRERSREAGGTGLGLAIVKHIVEAHGSTVEVQSEVGKGSTFSFMLKT